MPYTQAQNKATQKYQKEHLEQISIRVPKGDRARLKSVADFLDMSVSAFIIEAVNAKAGFQVLSVPGQRNKTNEEDD